LKFFRLWTYERLGVAPDYIRQQLIVTTTTTV
jgi:hypothetical protein